MTQSSDQPVQIAVRGEKVSLGCAQPHHLEAFARSMQDPEFAIYAGGGFRPLNTTQIEKMIEQIIQQSVVFTIFENPSLTPIGISRLEDINNQHGTATFSVALFEKSIWGQGYGTEVIRLTLAYGFSFLNLHNILLRTFNFNSRAIRAYEKAGFTVVGYRHGAVKLNGRRYDEVYMECLATAFTPPTPGWFDIENR